MKLEYIKEFVELTKTCNFQETADSLFIAQSTLSRHISSLEAELGILLFDRTTKNVRLSDPARVFLPYAQQLVEIEEQSIKALSEFKKTSQETVTIGAIPSMSHYNINELLNEFKNTYKYFSLSLIEDDTMELAQMLQDGILDFSYIRDADGENEMWKQFSKVVIGTDYLSAIVSTDHAFSRRKSISIKELQNENLIFLEKGSFSYSLSMSCCHKNGFEPKVAFTGKHARNLVDMAGSNWGILLLNEKSARHYKTNKVKLVRIVPEVKTQIVLAYNENVKMTKAAASFLDYVKNNMQAH